MLEGLKKSVNLRINTQYAMGWKKFVWKQYKKIWGQKKKKIKSKNAWKVRLKIILHKNSWKNFGFLLFYFFCYFEPNYKIQSLSFQLNKKLNAWSFILFSFFFFCFHSFFFSFAVFFFFKFIFFMYLTFCLPA